MAWAIGKSNYQTRQLRSSWLQSHIHVQKIDINDHGNCCLVSYTSFRDKGPSPFQLRLHSFRGEPSRPNRVGILLSLLNDLNGLVQKDVLQDIIETGNGMVSWYQTDIVYIWNLDRGKKHMDKMNHAIYK